MFFVIKRSELIEAIYVYKYILVKIWKGAGPTAANFRVRMQFFVKKKISKIPRLFINEKYKIS